VKNEADGKRNTTMKRCISHLKGVVVAVPDNHDFQGNNPYMFIASYPVIEIYPESRTII